MREKEHLMKPMQKLESELKVKVFVLGKAQLAGDVATVNRYITYVENAKNDITDEHNRINGELTRLNRIIELNKHFGEPHNE